MIKYLLILLIVTLLFNTSCKKETDIIAAEYGYVTDIENNIYKTIKIGNQWWMAENLKVKTFRNGVPVNSAQTNSQWTNHLGSFCVYDYNPDAPGLLYNWNVVSDSNNIAPEGWHVPTDSEWKELEEYLGMSHEDINKLNWRGTHEGEKLKVKGTTGWRAYGNVWSTNESGFTALSGSCRLPDGKWGDPGLFATGFWWTSTKSAENDAWYRYLDYKEAGIFRSKIFTSYGFSIRCIKD